MTLRAFALRVGLRQRGGAFAPFLFPSACALGYCLSPLRGFCESRKKGLRAFFKQGGALLVHGTKA